MKKAAAVFLDRDGVIIEEVGYLDNIEKIKIIPCAFEAIRLIHASGMKAVVISNQSGVARGLFTEEFVRLTHDRLQAMLREQSVSLDCFYFCPHHPTEGAPPYRRICDCRKPAPGMFLQAAKDLDIDLDLSYMVGDRLLDIEAAQTVGVKGVLVKTGHRRDLLQNDGADRLTEENKPDFIATDILEAVQWILQDRK